MFVLAALPAYPRLRVVRERASPGVPILFRLRKKRRYRGRGEASFVAGKPGAIEIRYRHPKAGKRTLDAVAREKQNIPVQIYSQILAQNLGASN